jgi:hypothetical protein
VSFERVDKKEPHCGHALLDSLGCQASITNQVKLKLPDLFRPQPIWGQMVILGEIP